MAFLKFDKGSLPGQILELHEERMVLGRHPSCQIVLENAAVSRQHAQILESHGQYYIEDLRSRNATLLNGVPVEGRAELNDQDRIQVCDVQFRFYIRLPSVDSSAAIKRGPSAVIDPNDPRLSAETLAETPIPSLHQLFLQAEPANDDTDTSSIINTLDAGSATSLRLDVKPETKLRAVLEISNSLSNTLKIEEIFEKTLDGLFRIFSQADEGFVLLFDLEQKKMQVKATRSRQGDGDSSVRISMTIVRQAMQNGEAILSADAAHDGRFKISESLVRLQIRSMMCVPLLDQNAKPLGVIQLDAKDSRCHFSQNDLDLLVSVASQVSLAVENAKLHEELLKQRDLKRDLEFATQIQLGFLPNQPPKVPSYEFCDFYEPALRVGGDYFDYVGMPDGRLAIALGDVAGKGIPAALLMARIFSAARFHLLTKPTAAAAMTGLNAEITSSGLGHRFVTCVIILLDPAAHEATISIAGHMAPLLRTAQGHVTSIADQESGIPLGIISNQEFGQAVVSIESGDSIILYTDGITEAMNPNSEIYGTERLVGYITNGPPEITTLIKGIVDDVEKFCEGRPQHDDMCLVGLRHLT